MKIIKKSLIHRTTINYYPTPADMHTAGSMLYFDCKITPEELEKKLEALRTIYPEMKSVRSNRQKN